MLYATDALYHDLLERTARQLERRIIDGSARAHDVDRYVRTQLELADRDLGAPPYPFLDETLQPLG